MAAVPEATPVPDTPPATPQLTGCEAVRAEIAKYGDWNVDVMAAIAKAENRACDPTRHNLSATETHRRADGSVICVGSYGVMQVGCLHYAAGDNYDDMATNIRLAHRVYQARKTWDVNGYNAWSTYKNGDYRHHL